MNDELPRWAHRVNVTRIFPDYSDLMSVVSHHFRTFSMLENFLGPYNARQRGKAFYTPPTKDEIRANVKQGNMNDISYSALLSCTIKFCESTKGTRALPCPHPSTVHSIQLPESAFALKNNQNKNGFLYSLSIPGAEELFLNGIREADKMKFAILRPKLSKLGTPSATQWEVLLFKQNHGYIPNWTDSTLNPRWAGSYN
jgi:hypothetical protein